MPSELDKARRRWFQFGIWDLLVLAILVGLACGWGIERAKHLRQLNDATQRADAMEAELQRVKKELWRLRPTGRAWQMDEGMRLDALQRAAELAS